MGERVLRTNFGNEDARVEVTKVSQECRGYEVEVTKVSLRSRGYEVEVTKE